MIHILGQRDPEKLRIEQLHADAALLHGAQYGIMPGETTPSWFITESFGGKVFFAKMVIGCPRYHGGRGALACAHCTSGDPERPERINQYPSGLTVCETCLGLVERHKIGPDLVRVVCWDCIQEYINKITAADPTRFRKLEKC